MPRRNALLHKIGNLFGNHPGFTATGAGQHQQGAVYHFDSSLLLRVEFVHFQAQLRKFSINTLN